MKVKGHPTNDLLSSYAFVTYNNKDSASEATEPVHAVDVRMIDPPQSSGRAATVNMR